VLKRLLGPLVAGVAALGLVTAGPAAAQVPLCADEDEALSTSVRGGPVKGESSNVVVVRREAFATTPVSALTITVDGVQVFVGDAAPPGGEVRVRIPLPVAPQIQVTITWNETVPSGECGGVDDYRLPLHDNAAVVGPYLTKMAGVETQWTRLAVARASCVAGASRASSARLIAAARCVERVRKRDATPGRYRAIAPPATMGPVQKALIASANLRKRWDLRVSQALRRAAATGTRVRLPAYPAAITKHRAGARKLLVAEGRITGASVPKSLTMVGRGRR